MKQLTPFLILFLVILGCSNSSQKNVSTTRTAPTPFQRKLSAEVRLSDTGVVVKNTDIIDFPSLSLKFNLKQWGSNDGQGSAGQLLKGKSVTIPYGEFTVGTARFNPRATKIMTIYVKSGDGGAKLFLCPGAICQPA